MRPIFLLSLSAAGLILAGVAQADMPSDAQTMGQATDQPTDQNGAPATDQNRGQSPRVVTLGVDSELSLERQFELLDRNGDAVVTRDEAAIDDQLLAIFDSLDADAALSNVGGDTPDGLTREQYEAGMTALANGGVVGPAVSGGGTFILQRDGSLRSSEQAER